MNPSNVPTPQQAAGPKVWVVVMSKPGQEPRAKRELENQGYEVYLPMRLYEPRGGPKVGVLCATPFLKGYLFARVPVLVQDWKSIFSTYGVAGVLGYSNNRAYGIKDDVIDKIRAHEEGGFVKLGLLEAEPKPAAFGSGDRVRVDDLVDAIFLEKLDGRRAMILVSLLGRASTHSVDIRRLAAQAAD